jgi:hypothetical protein
MYLTILILPLLGSFVSGFLGRKIGVTGSHIITCTCLILSSILATIAFYEVGLCSSPVKIYLFNWIDSEYMTISWEFLFDQLTVSMFIPVLYISSLIHIFSTDYMAEDPHNQRFFSYLSLFTFFMLVLVSGANYFVMFVGWEGIGIVSYLLINFWFTRIQANKAAILALTMNRVSKSKKGKAKYSMTMDVYSLNYLNHLDQTIYSQIADTKIYAYPNNLLPQHRGKEVTHYHFKTKTHPLFTALHSLWYKWDNIGNKFIKIVPLNISDMFSEISLAYWIMDDGYFDSHGRTQTVLLCTESFTKEECFTLQSILDKLDIKSTLKIRDKINNRYRIRISKTSMDRVVFLVKPYMHEDFLYKLGI